MNHLLKVKETEYKIESISTERGWEISIGDKKYEVTGTRLDEHTITASINGKRVQFLINEKQGEIQVVWAGKWLKIEDTAKLRKKKKAGGENAKDIKPPMPGAIVKVLVQAEEAVVKGQELLVMSAMKMETTLYAPCNGLIRSVLVQEGDQVMADQELFDFQPEEAEKKADA